MVEASRRAGRRWFVVLALLALAASIAIVQFGASDVDGRDLKGYRIVYDISVHLSTGEESSRREVTVRRPFTGADLTFGKGQDVPQSGTIADGAHTYTIQQGTAVDSGESPPDLPPGDYRFHSVVDDLVRLGLLEARSEDRIVDRDCIVYRSGAPLGDRLRRPSKGEFVDWCIDGDGLLLQERWFLDGDLLRETRAVRVELTTPDAEAFEISLPIIPSPTGISTREELAIDQHPEVGDVPYFVTTEDDHGLKLESRWRSMTTSSVTGVRQVEDIVFVDVYRRDVDIVLVLHREQSIADEEAVGHEEVIAGSLGDGNVFLGAGGSELRFEVDPWVVSVRGSLGVDDLVDFASGLASTGP